MKSGCQGACGQIEGDDELMHDADAVVVVVDVACVVHGAMDVSPLHNSFAETQEAMMIVFLCVSWFVMSVPVCDVVRSCSGECDVVIAGDVPCVPCICCSCCRCDCCCCCCWWRFFGCHEWRDGCEDDVEGVCGGGDACSAGDCLLRHGDDALI